jgi:hypothetical protein
VIAATATAASVAVSGRAGWTMAVMAVASTAPPMTNNAMARRRDAAWSRLSARQAQNAA